MMKRIGWLVLLISLGLNLGLGYRLLNHPRPWGEPPAREWGQGPGRGADQGPLHGEGPGPEMATDESDSTQWRRIMAGRLKRVAERLELTPEQLAVFQTTHRDNAAGLLAQRRLVEEARSRLQTVVAAGEAQPDSVRQAIREVGHRQAVLDSLITETMLLEMDVLTQEQRARYLQILPGLRGSAPGRSSGRNGHHRSR